MKENRVLTKLYLRKSGLVTVENNGIEDEGGNEIAKAISFNSTLTTLNIGIII